MGRTYYVGQSVTDENESASLNINKDLPVSNGNRMAYYRIESNEKASWLLTHRTTM